MDEETDKDDALIEMLVLFGLFENGCMRAEFKQHMKEFDLTALPAGPVRIFAVIRDGRGGVDFLERELSIPFISGAEEAVAEDQKCFDVKGVAK